MSDQPCVIAIDAGTTGVRSRAVRPGGGPVVASYREFTQHFPEPGLVEHDATEIWDGVVATLHDVIAEVGLANVAAIGITNQRETVLAWNRHTGQPYGTAIVWQDRRTAGRCDELAAAGMLPQVREITGLVLDPYFSGSKIEWLLANRDIPVDDDLALGTIDTWLLWNLTNGQVHATDPTNASRTLLMDLDTLQWDPELAEAVGVPMSMLPQIRSSSEVFGEVQSPASMKGVPISGILGDQQAATFGQACLSPGEAKNTYGTGNFLLLNTGTEKVLSSNGLLTTVCYKIGEAPAVYALEGSIAVTGSLVQWLRDNLGIIRSAPEIETLARSVEDNGDCYFVPAFSGLFAPYWRGDARGAIVGLTRFINKGHIARAALEAAAYQSREVIEAMEADSGVQLTTLKVDGGMVLNELLMQFQADVLGVPVIRPRTIETTALGAAYAAGLAVGFWENETAIRTNWAEGKRWEPQMSPGDREWLFDRWRQAVTRTFDWVPTGQ